MEDALTAWHALVKANDPDRLDDLLAEDAVFLSPIVHTPQQGCFITSLYLRAALALLNNDAFRYLNEWRRENSAVLEFEGVIDGITVNGVDMIWWNEANRITRFKVMVRPLKAVHLIHEKMAAALQAG